MQILDNTWHLDLYPFKGQTLEIINNYDVLKLEDESLNDDCASE